MENKKERLIDMSDDDIAKEIKKITNPIFLQAVSKNSMTTPNLPKTPIKILWRPNNYRREMIVKKQPNSTLHSTIRSAIPNTNYCEHTNKISVKDYKGITIQLDKTKITGIYSQNIISNQKETYYIESDTIQNLQERIEQRKEEIKNQIDHAIHTFCKQFNIEIIRDTTKWKRFEDWIKGEEYIDRIPEDMIIHDTYFKKVYETGIEFKKPKDIDVEPAVYVKNYIKNRAIEDFSPEIAKAMTNMTIDILNNQKSFQEQALKPLIEQITLHLSVLRKIESAADKLNTNLERKSIWQKIRNLFTKTKL